MCDILNLKYLAEITKSLSPQVFASISDIPSSTSTFINERMIMSFMRNIESRLKESST